MAKAGISIEDIARRAGVSHSTVSRALRDNPVIRASIRQQIQHMAVEMGYVPNAIAQSLQTKRTNTVGVVVTSIADPFFAGVVDGIEQLARSVGLSVILSVSHRSAQHELEVIDTFHRRRVDGLIVADSNIGKQYQAQLARTAVPTILINNQAVQQPEKFYSVSVDDRYGARLAVEHLIRLGHRSIGYLGVANRPRSNQNRLEGYRLALSKAGLSQFEVGPVGTEGEQDDVYTGQQLLLHLIEKGVTAVVCYNDMVAVGALLACRQAGLSVPHNLSLVGFDDLELARYVTPPLTTVHQPRREIGRTAMQMLLDLLNQKTVESQVLRPSLVERESCQPPSKTLI